MAGRTLPCGMNKEGVANKKNRQSGDVQGFAPRSPKFEDKCPDLKGYIHDATDASQPDQFINTAREIGEIVGRT